MLIDGKAIALDIEKNLAATISKIQGRKPGLAFILIGDHPASRSYIRMKRKKCKEVGIQSFDQEFAESVSEQEVLDTIERFNKNRDIDGILVQFPLPKHISPSKVVRAIDPDKDVDGFHPVNLGKLTRNENDGFLPCTPAGIVELLKRSQITTKGKNIIIVGRSNIVGKPLALLLMQPSEYGNATVTIAHSHTKNLKELCLNSDIIIAAVGQPGLITEEMVPNGCVVIDVGINRLEEGESKPRLIGDVDYERVKNKVTHITPVPGGVGPMTIAMLLANTLISYQRHQDGSS